MKRIFTFILVIITLFSLTSCKKEHDENTIVIGASLTPHKEILEQARPLLKELGYELEIEVYDDYILPNIALVEETIDANYFQHTYYLNDYNKGNGTNIVSAGIIHYEPMAIYGKNISSLEYADGKIYIPNDGTNQSRALKLLAENDLIDVKKYDDPSILLTTYDITNKNGFDIVPVDADLVPTFLKDGNNGYIAVINGNFALEANIDITSALASESSEGDAKTIYGNIIAVRSGDENSPKIQALISVLKSDTIKNYILKTYKNAVLPA